ncbi:phosphoribosyltransferase [Candidatus Daviesbacteria bacterium]|nr:phosphoribosyltransferase [Candidatus Daviesbacteria bacterium]
MKLFRNRQSAGKLLANKLKAIKADIILGIPRGGVVVASEVAKILKLPLDIIVTRKIGASTQPELALGALDSEGQAVWDEELLSALQLDAEDLKEKIEEERQEISRREKLYRQGKKLLDIRGKTIILVDDGMATGATTQVAIEYLKRHQARVILAVPIASQSALEKVEDEVEQVVVLEAPAYFQAVGQFYHQFEPVTDQEVIQLLNG